MSELSKEQIEDLINKRVELYENKIKKMERDFGERITMYEDKICDLELLILDKIYTDSNSRSVNIHNLKYPPAITKSGFPNNLSDIQGSSYFRFVNIQGNTASLEFCGTFEQARANKTELELACEIASSTADARKITNIGKGTVVLRDGKWEVTKKATIKFE